MSSQRKQPQLRSCPAVDRISNLPDIIICHILSFLPTKSAVRSSILSKQWKYIWTKVPVLDFTELPPSAKSFMKLTSQQKISFMNFVDRVLLRNDVACVQRLAINLDGRDFDFYIKSWLSLLSKRVICEIIFNCGTCWPEPIELPTNFFSSDKLLVLKLIGKFSISETMCLHLPNLETIHLENVSLPSDVFIKRLLSDCPTLKELRISKCHGITEYMFIESMSLKIVKICMNGEVSIFIKFKAPNLRYLGMSGNFVPCLIGDLSMLVEANIDISYPDLDEAIHIANKVSRVKTLTLSCFECHIFYAKQPIFSNLTCLKISSDANMHMLLECTPKLKFLSCDIVLGGMLNDLRHEQPPKCMSCIERAEFCLYYDVDDDEGNSCISVVEYFLKFGLVLKEVKIHIDEPMDINGQIEVYEKLLKIPRSSAACQVTS